MSDTTTSVVYKDGFDRPVIKDELGGDVDPSVKAEVVEDPDTDTTAGFAEGLIQAAKQRLARVIDEMDEEIAQRDMHAANAKSLREQRDDLTKFIRGRKPRQARKPAVKQSEK